MRLSIVLALARAQDHGAFRLSTCCYGRLSIGRDRVHHPDADRRRASPLYAAVHLPAGDRANDWPFAAALAIVFMAAVLLVVYLLNLLGRLRGARLYA